MGNVCSHVRETENLADTEFMGLQWLSRLCLEFENWRGPGELLVFSLGWSGVWRERTMRVTAETHSPGTRAGQPAVLLSLDLEREAQSTTGRVSTPQLTFSRNTLRDFPVACLSFSWLQIQSSWQLWLTTPKVSVSLWVVACPPQSCGLAFYSFYFYFNFFFYFCLLRWSVSLGVAIKEIVWIPVTFWVLSQYWDLCSGKIWHQHIW